jgi:hypothetical protein
MYTKASPKHLRLIVKLNLNISNKSIRWMSVLQIHAGTDVLTFQLSHEAIESDLVLADGKL